MAGKPIGLHAPNMYVNHDIHPIPIPKPAVKNPAGKVTESKGYSSDVIVNGREVHRVGDEFIEHTAPLLPPPPPHSDVIGDVGNPRIIVNGKPIVGQGATIAPGGNVLMGSYSVYM